jgi:F0F1-type ATP synthase assembly protein I
MVAPLLVGIALDHYLGWRPWATLAGVLFGFVGGLAHLIMLGNRDNSADSSEPPGNTPC